jgi:hypothetical protein
MGEKPGGRTGLPAQSALGVASVVDLDAFWNKALAALTTTTADDVLAVFGFHSGAKAELALTGPLGRLVGPFGAHGVLSSLKMGD